MSVCVSEVLVVVLFRYLCLVYSARIKRVIGGHEVTCGTQPRIGSLRNASVSEHLCGATLLTSRFAITAAHCVDHEPQEYVIYLNNYCKRKYYPKATVLEVNRHDLYDSNSQAHDIALLRINLDIDDIKWLDTNVLPTSSFGLSGECLIYGYGFKNIDVKETSNELMSGVVKLVSLDDCTKALGPRLAPQSSGGMLCALGDGVDSCQGDSGGPLICNGLIEGISSYGMSCGVPGIPGVYTSIGMHIHWIRRTMEIND